jgi:late competence protein required for DNA uptake (superfamily II DNA/RNA helicase)
VTTRAPKCLYPLQGGLVCRIKMPCKFHTKPKPAPKVVVTGDITPEQRNKILNSGKCLVRRMEPV